MTLKSNLPDFIANEKYTEEILNAIEPEIDNLRLTLSNALLECCVSTATNIGVQRFEKDYSIKYNATLSLDERKSQIINKMLAKKALTKEALVSFIKRNIDNNQFYISNSAEDYSFKVMLVDENYREKLYKALYKARPANLLFEITMTSYERRCGAFNCNAAHPV